MKPRKALCALTVALLTLATASPVFSETSEGQSRFTPLGKVTVENWTPDPRWEWVGDAVTFYLLLYADALYLAGGEGEGVEEEGTYHVDGGYFIVEGKVSLFLYLYPFLCLSGRRDGGLQYPPTWPREGTFTTR